MALCGLILNILKQGHSLNPDCLSRQGPRCAAGRPARPDRTATPARLTCTPPDPCHDTHVATRGHATGTRLHTPPPHQAQASIPRTRFSSVLGSRIALAGRARHEQGAVCVCHGWCVAGQGRRGRRMRSAGRARPDPFPTTQAIRSSLNGGWEGLGGLSTRPVLASDPDMRKGCGGRGLSNRRE